MYREQCNGGKNWSLGGFEGLCTYPVRPKTAFRAAQAAGGYYICVIEIILRVQPSKTETEKVVDYARENQSVILYDAAYEAFIKEEGAS